MKKKLMKDESGRTLYVGNPPSGKGWEKLDVELVGNWSVWVLPADMYGRGEVKVVSTVPRVRKANYRMNWSTRLERLCMGADHDRMADLEKKTFSQLTEVLRDHYRKGEDR